MGGFGPRYRDRPEWTQRSAKAGLAVTRARVDRQDVTIRATGGTIRQQNDPIAVAINTVTIRASSSKSLKRIRLLQG